MMDAAQIEVNGRFLILNKKWGKQIFEIILLEVSPSKAWFKIVEVQEGGSKKDRKPIPQWHVEGDIIFLERLADIATDTIEDLERELE